MKTIKYLSYMVLSTFVLSVMTSCEPKALTQDDVFLDPASLDEILAEENPEGYTVYNLNDFLKSHQCTVMYLCIFLCIFKEFGINQRPCIDNDIGFF